MGKSLTAAQRQAISDGLKRYWSSHKKIKPKGSGGSGGINNSNPASTRKKKVLVAHKSNLRPKRKDTLRPPVAKSTLRRK